MGDIYRWQTTTKQTKYEPCAWDVGIPSEAHDDVMKWKHFLRYWPFVRGIRPGEFPAPRPVTRSFDVFLIFAWTNSWVNNGNAGGLRLHHADFDVIAMSENSAVSDVIRYVWFISCRADIHSCMAYFDSFASTLFYLLIAHSIWISYLTFIVKEFKSWIFLYLTKQSSLACSRHGMPVLRWKPDQRYTLVVAVRQVLLVFIRPFEKRTYYAVAMSVRPSVRLSVRPSVRPSGFSGLFFNMLWDINLKLGIYIQ